MARRAFQDRRRAREAGKKGAAIRWAKVRAARKPLEPFSGTILGMQAFAISAAYVAMTIMARHLWMERGLPLMATVFVGGCVRGLAAVAVAALLATRAPVWQHVVRYGFLEAAAAALVAPAVFRCVTWEKRLLGLG